MDEMTLVFGMGATVGHGVAAFHPGLEAARRPASIGDQQAAMALRACRRPQPKAAATPDARRSELICLHCGSAMTLIEDVQLGDSLHLSAQCPRCGCLRATYLELPAQRLLELPQEVSFD
jgi:hypothetical protein